jgi:hypothetical protein
MPCANLKDPMDEPDRVYSVSQLYNHQSWIIEPCHMPIDILD